MKLLMFGWEFPPYHKGGLGIATYNLALALAKEGVELTFVLPKRLDVKMNEFNILFAEGLKSIKVYELDSSLTPYISSQEYLNQGWNKLGLYGSSLFSEVKRYADVVKQIVSDGDYDVVHAHDWLTIGAGIQAQQNLQKPLINHVHATEVERSGGNGVNEVVYALEKEGLNKSDAIITVSAKTKDLVAENYYISHNKIHVVHNGIDVSQHNSNLGPDESIMRLKAKGKKIILYLGRLTIAKAPDIFLKAFKRLLEYEKDAILVFVGNGEMEAQLINYVSENKISDKVLFTGWVSDKEKINSLYKTADLFVMPSIMEPFGLVALESAINNTPTLISKQSGVSEVLNHALKVDFWDVDEMVNMMLAVFKYSSLHSTLQENGKKEALGVTWQKAAHKCIKLYEKLIQEKSTQKNYLLSVTN